MIKLLITLCLVFTHEFYISITQINHNQKNESLEVTVKLFTDDIEKSLEMGGTEKLRLGDKREHPSTNELLENYIENNLALFEGDNELDLQFLGKEVELDVTWCYLEVANIKEFSKLTVENNILLDILDGQTNVVHIKVNGTESSLLMNKGNTRDSVTF